MSTHVDRNTIILYSASGSGQDAHDFDDCHYVLVVTVMAARVGPVSSLGAGAV